MISEDKYQEVIKVLKNSAPSITDKQKLTDNIMKEISVSANSSSFQEKFSHYLFGWMKIYWLRGTMAVLATLFIGFFIIQQLTIADRLNKLETQLVKTEAISGNKQGDLGPLQRVIIKIMLSPEDSITVSKSDLEKLLNSYLELQEQNANPGMDIQADTKKNTSL